MTYDALIIGGGPAGATAAILLAHAGWTVAVVEKKSFPRRKVCGEFISATSLPILQQAGVLDEFLAHAGPEIRRVGLFAQDVALAAPIAQPSNAIGGFGRALGREHLDGLLLKAAAQAGAELWQPGSVQTLRRTVEGYACTVTSASESEELAAAIVIAAHGSWEPGPLPTQIAAAHEPSDLLAFKAHFTDSDLPPDLMPLLAFPGGYGGMVHSDGGRVSLSCCIRRDVLHQCRTQGQRAGDAVLQHIQRHCAGVREGLRRAKLEHAWLSAGPIRPGIRTFHKDGIFLAGNSAGEAHPIVAEGISMAMQSAALLCRHLIAHREAVMAGRGLDRIGNDYARDWKRAFAARIRAAALFAHCAMSPTVGTIALPVMRRFPQTLTIGAQLSGKANQAFA